MSSDKKRRVSSTQESKEIADALSEEVQVEFEGRNAEQWDFHGIKKLLHQLLVRAPVDTTELTDLIIGQSSVGSVLKQCVDEYSEVDDDDDEDEVFGITTIVTLTTAKSVPCVEQLKAFFLDKSKVDPAAEKILKNSFEHCKQNAALLINERFVNISPLVTIPLFESLFTEITNACLKSNDYRFELMILIVKLYKQFDPNEVLLEEIYTNPEEEIFYENALASFDFSVQAEIDTAVGGDWNETDPQLIPFRRVILLESGKLSSILLGIKTSLGK